MQGNRFSQVVLLSLREMGDRPMPDTVLRSAIRISIQPSPTEADMTAKLRQMEEQELILGVDDQVLGRFWGLTTTGKQKANQL